MFSSWSDSTRSNHSFYPVYLTLPSGVCSVPESRSPEWRAGDEAMDGGRQCGDPEPAQRTRTDLGKKDQNRFDSKLYGLQVVDKVRLPDCVDSLQNSDSVQYRPNQ